MYWLLTLNSAVNPVIYVAFNRELRRPLVRMVPAFLRRSSGRKDSTTMGTAAATAGEHLPMSDANQSRRPTIGDRKVLKAALGPMQ